MNDPDFLNPEHHIDDLVQRFSEALREKLRESEAKYGWNNHWRRPAWREDLVTCLLDHVQKGDPRDVAAYCAFAWHHGWSVTPTTTQDAAAVADRLRQKLVSLECPALGGDNLGVFLASEFEPGFDSDEMDDSGTWKQGAIDQSNQVLDAIHAHYATSIQSQAVKIEQLEHVVAGLNKQLTEQFELSSKYVAKAMAASSVWREIDLAKGIKHDHPDISTDKKYLVKVYGGWFFGRFTRQWYGLSFSNWGSSGCQFDVPGFNSSQWEHVIEIDPEAMIAGGAP